MSKALTDAKLHRYRRILNERLERLRVEIVEGSVQQSSERFIDLAGEVHDEAEQSVGVEQTDLRNAMIGRDIGEVRSIEAALARIESGHYGTCTGCGESIDSARLEVQPSALRCTPCQVRHERSFSTHAPPSL